MDILSSPLDQEFLTYLKFQNEDLWIFQLLHACIWHCAYAYHLKIDRYANCKCSAFKSKYLFSLLLFLLDQKQNENKVLVLPPIIQSNITRNLYQNDFVVQATFLIKIYFFSKEMVLKVVSLNQTIISLCHFAFWY